jgi:hypothetical protein
MTAAYNYHIEFPLVFHRFVPARPVATSLGGGDYTWTGSVVQKLFARYQN